MSGWLLDANVLLGCGWQSHPDHPALLSWLLRSQDWATCPLTESAFMRISHLVQHGCRLEREGSSHSIWRIAVAEPIVIRNS